MQHLSQHTTPFDRQYTQQTQYKLVILDRKCFSRAANTAEFLDDTMRPAVDWMDARERHFIAHFGTYLHGWNSTTGGQGGWLVAMREAIAKQSYIRFRDDYMPMFRRYHEVHGHINAPRSDKTLGVLVNSIRNAHTVIPPMFQDELEMLGFDTRNQYIVQRDARWTDVYLPAFHVFHGRHGHINAPQSHPVLGRLLNSIRAGITVVPSEFDDELIQMGLDMRNQYTVSRDARWIEYMKTFRMFQNSHGHVNVPSSHPMLGVLVSDIRNGHTSVPPAFMEEVRELNRLQTTAQEPLKVGTVAKETDPPRIFQLHPDLVRRQCTLHRALRAHVCVCFFCSGNGHACYSGIRALVDRAGHAQSVHF